MFLGRFLVSFALAAAVVLGGPQWAAEPAGPEPQNAHLAGQLLVATAELDGPVFAQTVIYMVRHDPRGGAMGLIVNRRLGEVPMDVLLKQSGLPSASAKGSVRLHMGGPVEATRVFALHTDDYTGPDTLKIADGVAITDNAVILKDIAEGKGPRRARFMLGYAGWAPGQLEAEMEAGSWIVVPSDAAIVFDDAYDTKWSRATAKRRISL